MKSAATVVEPSPSVTGKPKGRFLSKISARNSSPTDQVNFHRKSSLIDGTGTFQKVWGFSAKALTCLIPNLVLSKCFGMKNPSVRQAWREKTALCIIFFWMCVFLGYFTFFLQITSCPSKGRFIYSYTNSQKPGYLDTGKAILFGKIYKLDDYLVSIHPNIKGTDLTELGKQITNNDISNLFVRDQTPNCDELGVNVPRSKTCRFGDIQHCHIWNMNLREPGAQTELKDSARGDVYFEWNDIYYRRSRQLTAYNGKVIDLTPYFDSNATIMPPEYDAIIRQSVQRDSSLFFQKNNPKLAECLIELYYVGDLDAEPMMCIAANIILTVAMVVICCLVVVKFIMAQAFGWALSWQLGKIQQSRSLFSRKKDIKVVTAATHPQEFSLFRLPNFSYQYREIYTIMLVTCYSEGEDGLRTTMDSLAQTDYDDRFKMVFIIADGVVKGSGNNLPTGDIVLNMMELDEAYHGPIEYDISIDPKTDAQIKKVKCRNAEPQSYEAIGAGSKRHNMARVYCGTYVSGAHRIATVLIYKCGSPAENGSAKPGNRGKRDSQVILMDFASKMMFNERFSPLQFDMFTKITHIMTVQNHAETRVTPDLFEIVLMVDADTKVMPDSLTRMVAVMQRDPMVMGLCGETKIMNKNESFISMMQVFEYYASHHMAKSFESMFGGVTCLPGCFCMYRLKAPKPIDPASLDNTVDPYQQCLWVPIIANPDIVHDYSASSVDTLHKKNLLLLGEDRYLSTLMLRTFPRRKMMFVPKALCKTTVPAEFQVLLSQRRRWINSTIHNLFELVLVRELCGTFCFSMQFVVFLELIGTITLPAAICFTIAMLIVSIVGPVVPWVPLILLAAILGLPSVLIVTTTRNFKYLFYMIVYIISLPIWNFVLPVYAYWHFDDFSWGQTRQVEGEKKGEDSHGHGGDSSSGHDSSISLKHWHEWESERQRFLSKEGLRDPVGVVTKEITRVPKKRRKSKIGQIAEKLGIISKSQKLDNRPASAPEPSVPRIPGKYAAKSNAPGTLLESGQMLKVKPSTSSKLNQSIIPSNEEEKQQPEPKSQECTTARTATEKTILSARSQEYSSVQTTTEQTMSSARSNPSSGNTTIISNQLSSAKLRSRPSSTIASPNTYEILSKLGDYS